MRPDRQLCEQVKALILAASLTEPGTGDALNEDFLSINYLPRFEPSDVASTKIVIAPRARTKAPLSRVKQRREHAIQVAVLRQCKATDELFESLLDFVDEIESAIVDANWRSDLQSVTRVGSYASSTTDLYDIQQLEQHNVFRSVITVNYLIYG